MLKSISTRTNCAIEGGGSALDENIPNDHEWVHFWIPILRHKNILSFADYQ